MSILNCHHSRWLHQLMLYPYHQWLQKTHGIFLGGSILASWVFTNLALTKITFFFKPDIKVTLQITFHRFFIHHDFFLPSTGSILWHPERPQDILRGSELEPGNAVPQGGCGKTVKLLGESSHWWSKASYYRQLRFWIGDPIELDGDSQPQRWRLTMDIQQ